MSQFVILALNIEDAHSEHRRLLEEEPERVKGMERISMCFPNNLRAIEGLRVSDWSSTDRAKHHPSFLEAEDMLGRSHLKSTYRG